MESALLLAAHPPASILSMTRNPTRVRSEFPGQASGTVHIEEAAHPSALLLALPMLGLCRCCFPKPAPRVLCGEEVQCCRMNRRDLHPCAAKRPSGSCFAASIREHYTHACPRSRSLQAPPAARADHRKSSDDTRGLPKPPLSADPKEKHAASGTMGFQGGYVQDSPPSTVGVERVGGSGVKEQDSHDGGRRRWSADEDDRLKEVPARCCGAFSLVFGLAESAAICVVLAGWFAGKYTLTKSGSSMTIRVLCIGCTAVLPVFLLLPGWFQYL